MLSAECLLRSLLALSAPFVALEGLPHPFREGQMLHNPKQGSEPSCLTNLLLLNTQWVPTMRGVLAWSRRIAQVEPATQSFMGLRRWSVVLLVLSSNRRLLAQALRSKRCTLRRGGVMLCPQDAVGLLVRSRYLACVWDTPPQDVSGTPPPS